MDHAFISNLTENVKTHCKRFLFFRIQCLDIPGRISPREVTWFTEITTVYRNPDFILNTD